MPLSTPNHNAVAFAQNGQKNTIPVESQAGTVPNGASYADGFPAITVRPIAAGGLPPRGQDINGILFDLSSAVRWEQSGGGYPFNAEFASSIGGYPIGAMVASSNKSGYWINTVDGNMTDPDGASPSGWFVGPNSGVSSVSVGAADITLTPAQYGKEVIILSGALTANINLTFPAITGCRWLVINKSSGNFTVTAKRAGISDSVPIRSGMTVNVYSDGSSFVADTGYFLQSGTGAVTRSMQDKARERVSIKDFGARADGVSDDTAALYSASQSGMFVEFTPGVYMLSPASIAKLPNGRLELSENTVFFAKNPGMCKIKTTHAANPLIYVGNPGVGIVGLGFDFHGSVNAVRCIQVAPGADGFTAERIKISGMTSSAFIRAIEINDAVKSFSVSDAAFTDLYATPNSVVGDNNGSVRGIYIGGNGVVPTSIGNGRVSNIYGEDIQTVEDADLIHVSSASSEIFGVVISNVQGRNVAKRLVKLQARGVFCDGVHADATANTVPMYSVVSAYNDDCCVKDVKGVGSIAYGVDTNGSVIVDGVTLNVTTAVPSGGVGVKHEGLGSPIISNVLAVGQARNAVYVFSAVGAVDTVNVSNVVGKCLDQVVRVEAYGANAISSVVVSGVVGSTSSPTSRTVSMLPASGASAAIASITLKDAVLDNGGYFTSVELAAQAVVVQDISSKGETSATLQINNAAYADVRDIRHVGNTASHGVLYLNCNNTTSDGIRTNQPTSSGSGVRYSGGSSHLWTNVFIPSGVAPSSVTGGASNVYGGVSTTLGGVSRVADNLYRGPASQLQFTGLGAQGWGAGTGHAYNADPLRMGSHYLWVDASGKLRIKGSAPTSDADGTVVGAQV